MADLLLFRFQQTPDQDLNKREKFMIVRDNFCLFCIKIYVVSPHLNRLIETVQMRGHNIWFQ